MSSLVVANVGVVTDWALVVDILPFRVVAAFVGLTVVVEVVALLVVAFTVVLVFGATSNVSSMLFNKNGLFVVSAGRLVVVGIDLRVVGDGVTIVTGTVLFSAFSLSK